MYKFCFGSTFCHEKTVCNYWEVGKYKSLPSDASLANQSYPALTTRHCVIAATTKIHVFTMASSYFGIERWTAQMLYCKMQDKILCLLQYRNGVGATVWKGLKIAHLWWLAIVARPLVKQKIGKHVLVWNFVFFCLHSQSCHARGFPFA